GTGISYRVKKGTLIFANEKPARAAPTFLRLASDERRLAFQKWSSIRVLRPVFRFGRPACISQHLCSFEIGVPCESCTHLGGFGARCLGCSANETFKCKFQIADFRFTGRKLALPPGHAFRALTATSFPWATSCPFGSRCRAAHFRTKPTGVASPIPQAAAAPGGSCKPGRPEPAP